MIRALMSGIDLSHLGVTALVLFVIAFLMVLFGVARLSRHAVEHCAAIPLSDEPTKDSTNE